MSPRKKKGPKATKIVRPGKPIPKPGKPLKPGKPILPGFFDLDSYPIWYNLASFLPGRPHETKIYFGYDYIEWREDRSDFTHLYLGINLSSKLKIHGWGIIYKVFSDEVYFHQLALRAGEQNLFYEGNGRYSDKERTELKFKTRSDHRVEGPITLTLRTHFGELGDMMYIWGVRIQVKDV